MVCQNTKIVVRSLAVMINIVLTEVVALFSFARNISTRILGTKQAFLILCGSCIDFQAYLW